ncbi:DUF1330 domain-containing protein [Sphingomonas sp. URHD0057]|uniref:DUF1330 domain-containing protein n=1 Tax=Sphingomonas sp. URHD0057 TaxID=1380389 RepID=UPI000492127C|nr:DUF1330 domain-containing protein [Sphingomonas sp. URHD0057]
MAAYLVASIHVHNPLGYDEYRSRTQSIVEAHGGRFLVRGGTVHPLEGAEDIERFVVIEFPSVEAARVFYDSADYQRILPARTDNAATDMFIVEGA